MGNAVIQLKTPLIGKHYYPHGVEYGEDENFPDNLVDRATNLVSKIKDDIDQYKNRSITTARRIHEQLFFQREPTSVLVHL